MSDAIQPALAPASWHDYLERLEWARQESEGQEIDGDEDGVSMERAKIVARCVEGGAGFHAAAAVALHGQPFGFTHEDVDLLLDVVLEDSENPRVQAQLTALTGLADRLAALLPPKEGA